jgi:hypothetical protein
VKKYPLRNLLQQNEPYTKLKKWYYNNCVFLNLYDDDNNNNNKPTFDSYEQYFNSHIVSGCNDVTSTGKTCRKTHNKKQRQTQKQIQRKTQK